MEGKPNFAAIKAKISLIDLLTHFVPTYSYEQTSDAGELRGKCPFGDCQSSRSFTFNRIKNVFNCFACKRRGTVIDFVKFSVPLDTLVEAARFIERQFFQKLQGDNQVTGQKPVASIMPVEPQQAKAAYIDRALIEREKYLDFVQRAGEINRSLILLQNQTAALADEMAVMLKEFRG